MMRPVDAADLELAQVQLSSLLHKCEAALNKGTLNPSRQTLMTNRIAALRTALELVADAQSRHSP